MNYIRKPAGRPCKVDPDQAKEAFELYKTMTAGDVAAKMSQGLSKGKKLNAYRVVYLVRWYRNRV